MKQPSKTIVFFGNERLATGVETKATALKSLIQNGYEVAALIVNQDFYKSRRIKDLEVEAIAKQNGIPLLRPHKLNDIKQQLRELNAQAGILAAYGKIIPADIINIFPKGILNIHPSLLPKGRGPTPIEEVMLEGAKETGVSIMQLAEEMDAGPVFAQSTFQLKGTETKQYLADSLLNLGAELLIKYLPGILSGTAASMPQNNQEATYNKLIAKQDGLINWDKPVQRVVREVRAYKNWPKSHTQLASQEVIVTEASATEGVPSSLGSIIIKNDRLLIGCKDGLLEILKLQPVNKPEMTARAFLAGYKKLLETTG